MKSRLLRALVGAALLFVAVRVGIRIHRAVVHGDEWGFRRALPSTASDVHEAFEQEGTLPDYQYCLKARITADEFAAYARRLRLTPDSPGRVYEDDENWSDLACVPGTGSWWNPPPTRDGWLIGQGGDTWTTAAYHDGHLYLSSVNH